MNRNTQTAERRFFTAPVQVRSTEGDQPELVIQGVSARMESRTLLFEWDNYKVYEEIASGAFDDALSGDLDCRCLFNHNSSNVLGRTTNNTLSIKVENNDLRFESVLPNTVVAKDVYQLIQRGDVNQCSFQFTIETEDRIELSKTEILYRITKIGKLYDVGPVTFPAYENTSVSARDIESIKHDLIAREESHNVVVPYRFRNILRMVNAQSINQ